MSDTPIPADVTAEMVAVLLGDDGVSSCPTPMCNGSFGWEPIEWEGEPHWHTYCGCGWLNDLVPESHLRGVGYNERNTEVPDE